MYYWQLLIEFIIYLFLSFCQHGRLFCSQTIILNIILNQTSLASNRFGTPTFSTYIRIGYWQDHRLIFLSVDDELIHYTHGVEIPSYLQSKSILFHIGNRSRWARESKVIQETAASIAKLNCLAFMHKEWFVLSHVRTQIEYKLH